MYDYCPRRSWRIADGTPVSHLNTQLQFLRNGAKYFTVELVEVSRSKDESGFRSSSTRERAPEAEPDGEIILPRLFRRLRAWSPST